jgi:hypothetical protein
MPCKDLQKRLEKLAEKIFLVRAELVDIFCNHPLSKINFYYANVKVCKRVDVMGVAVADNPKFDGIISVITYKGKHIVFELNYVIVEMYAILKPSGEPLVEGLEDRLRQLSE